MSISSEPVVAYEPPFVNSTGYLRDNESCVSQRYPSQGMLDRVLESGDPYVFSDEEACNRALGENAFWSRRPDDDSTCSRVLFPSSEKKGTGLYESQEECENSEPESTFYGVKTDASGITKCVQNENGLYGSEKQCQAHGVPSHLKKMKDSPTLVSANMMFLHMYLTNDPKALNDTLAQLVSLDAKRVETRLLEKMENNDNGVNVEEQSTAREVLQALNELIVSDDGVAKANPKSLLGQVLQWAIQARIETWNKPSSYPPLTGLASLAQEIVILLGKEADVRDLEFKQAELEQQIDRLNAQLNWRKQLNVNVNKALGMDLTSPVSLEEQIKRLEQENVNLKQLNQTLQDRVANHTANDNEEIKALREKVSRKMEENEATIHKLHLNEQKHKRIVEQLRSQYGDLQKEFDQFRDQTEEAHNALLQQIEQANLDNISQKEAIRHLNSLAATLTIKNQDTEEEAARVITLLTRDLIDTQSERARIQEHANKHHQRMQLTKQGVIKRIHEVTSNHLSREATKSIERIVELATLRDMDGVRAILFSLIEALKANPSETENLVRLAELFAEGYSEASSHGQLIRLPVRQEYYVHVFFDVNQTDPDALEELFRSMWSKNRRAIVHASQGPRLLYTAPVVDRMQTIAETVVNNVFNLADIIASVAEEDRDRQTAQNVMRHLETVFPDASQRPREPHKQINSKDVAERTYSYFIYQVVFSIDYAELKFQGLMFFYFMWLYGLSFKYEIYMQAMFIARAFVVSLFQTLTLKNWKSFQNLIGKTYQNISRVTSEKLRHSIMPGLMATQEEGDGSSLKFV